MRKLLILGAVTAAVLTIVIVVLIVSAMIYIAVLSTVIYHACRVAQISISHDTATQAAIALFLGSVAFSIRKDRRENHSRSTQRRATLRALAERRGVPSILPPGRA